LENGPSVYDIALQNQDGSAHSLEVHKGQVLIINLWATWCAPCIREMPDLNRLAAEVTGQGIQVLAVASGRQGAQTPQDFMQSRSLLNLTLATDHRMVLLDASGKRGLPTTLIADETGQIRGVLAGIAKWDAPEVIEAILSLPRP